jgi:hypothetical protein
MQWFEYLHVAHPSGCDYPMFLHECCEEFRLRHKHQLLLEFLMVLLCYLLNEVARGYLQEITVLTCPNRCCPRYRFVTHRLRMNANISECLPIEQRLNVHRIIQSRFKLLNRDRPLQYHIEVIRFISLLEHVGLRLHLGDA